MKNNNRSTPMNRLRALMNMSSKQRKYQILINNIKMNKKKCILTQIKTEKPPVQIKTEKTPVQIKTEKTSLK